MPPAKQRSDYLKGLVWGPQGHGKTWFVGTMALDDRTAPVLILDFEGGAGITLRGLPGPHEVVKVTSWDDYNTQFERLVDNKDGFKSVAIDSLSETVVFAQFSILASEASRRKEPDLIQQQDYNIAGVQIKRLVREFRDLPMHVIFTASAQAIVDPREGLISKPSMSGKLADDIPGTVDVSAYVAVTEDGDGKPLRSLVLQNYPKIRTKVRTPWGVVAPDDIDNPTITTVLDLLGW